MNNILVDLYTKGITEISVQTQNQYNKDNYCVYKLRDSNLEFVSNVVNNLFYIGVPKGLSTHWFYFRDKMR
jgi:hypothetical protein